MTGAAILAMICHPRSAANRTLQTKRWAIGAANVQVVAKFTLLRGFVGYEAFHTTCIYYRTSRDDSCKNTVASSDAARSETANRVQLNTLFKEFHCQMRFGVLAILFFSFSSQH